MATKKLVSFIFLVLGLGKPGLKGFLPRIATNNYFFALFEYALISLERVSPAWLRAGIAPFSL